MKPFPFRLKKTDIAHAFALVCRTLCAVSGFGLTISVAAQSIAPTHYRTPEGVDVFVGRERPPVPAPEAASSARRMQGGVLGPEVSSVTGKERPAPIGLAEQAARDKERLTILTAELVEEGRALEANRQALRSPRTANDLTTEQLEALRNRVTRHEANVRALNAEIRHATAPAVASGADAVGLSRRTPGAPDGLR